jgi:hypothetical protein
MPLENGSGPGAAGHFRGNFRVTLGAALRAKIGTSKQAAEDFRRYYCP